MRYPILFKLIVLFVFFLPLVSVQLPSVAFGFSINFARFFILLASIVLFMNIVLNPKYLKLNQGIYNNPYVRWLFYYFIFSLGYYYVSLFLGHTLKFGSSDFFSRNWQGRPLMQLAVFFTYGVVPFYLIKKYAQQEAYRKIIERSFIFTTLLIVYYGFFQQISHYLGLPITGLTLYDGRAATFKAGGVGILRFFSLAGEPRQAGIFLLGAFFFYLYYTQGAKGSLFTKLNLVLIVVAFFMTFSTSVYLAAAVSIGVILFDALINKRIRVRFRYIKYGIGALLIALLIFRSGAVSIIRERPARYYESIASKIQGKSGYNALLTMQALEIVILPYLQQITKISPFQLLFGYGYGNFLTPVAPLLKEHFDLDIIQEGGFGDTNSYLIKIFIESGIISLFFYFMILFYTLRLNSKLLHFYRPNQNRKEYTKTIWLRLSFITFFVANAIQISFFYFIIMGLIVGKLNGVARSIQGEANALKKI